MNARAVGERIRLLRLVAGLGQVELAERVGIANGSISKLENGRMSLSSDLLETLAQVLDCSPEFLQSPSETVVSRPWLRAYADASKRTVDAQIADCALALEVIERLDLTRLPDVVPIFAGDLSDEMAIEEFALEVRAAAQLGEGDVVGNATRSVERLGCLVLPMRNELGRHVGMSLRGDLMPVICVSRPSHTPERHVPGDRQRLTIAHELGHLALHGSLGPPRSAREAADIERQAFRFAGAFLAPGDAILEDLNEQGRRVTLRTLAGIKERWGIAIKALVMRFRQLGVIDEDHARSLYKQISARGWNKNEPVPVGNEEAIWLRKAIGQAQRGHDDPFAVAAQTAGIGVAYLHRWTEWGPTGGDRQPAEVVELPSRATGTSHRPARRAESSVTRLPAR